MSPDVPDGPVVNSELELLTRIAERLNAMGHPTRLMIIGALKSRQEASVGELAELLQVPLASVSQHLKVMERVGLLRYRRAGRQNYYSVRMQMVTEICDAICHQLEHELEDQSHQCGVFQSLKSRLQG